jgi:tetratricopeptide (TPR) repeat protein
MTEVLLLVYLAAAPAASPELLKARDAQSLPQLEQIASQLSSAADRQPGDARAQYQAALAQSTAAEVATELHDKNRARGASEAGMKAAERAVALKSSEAEYHRIWGTLCGQEAAAVGALGALKYGRCALDEVNKAMELDPHEPMNYLSRGIGNYYLPAAFGGGVELAVKDFERAISLDANSADAHLWLGIALRKLNRNAEARKEFERAAKLNPARLWAKQQFEKTPPQ